MFLGDDEEQEDNSAYSGQEKLNEQRTKHDSWSIDSSLYIRPLMSLIIIRGFFLATYEQEQKNILPVRVEEF